MGLGKGASGWHIPVSGGMQPATSAPAIWVQGRGRKGGPTDHLSSSPESPQRPAGRGWPTQLGDGFTPGLVTAATKHLLQSEHGDQCWRLHPRGTSQGPGYLIMHLGCRKGLGVVGAAAMCLQLPQLPPGPLLPILLGLPEGLPGFGWPPTPPPRCPQRRIKCCCVSGNVPPEGRLQSGCWLAAVVCGSSGLWDRREDRFPY